MGKKKRKKRLENDLKKDTGAAETRSLFSSLRNKIIIGIASTIIIAPLGFFFKKKMEERSIQQEKEYSSPRINTSGAKQIKLSNQMKRFDFIIDNTNKNSVPVLDFNITYHFPNNITEVKKLSMPSKIIRGARFGDLEIQKKNEDGTVDIVQEEEPNETPITKKCSFSVGEDKITEKNVRNNLLLFSCDYWPPAVTYVGKVIVDPSSDPKWKGMIGQYQGEYSYEIRGRRFTEQINGTIPGLDGL